MKKANPKRKFILRYRRLLCRYCLSPYVLHHTRLCTEIMINEYPDLPMKRGSHEWNGRRPAHLIGLTAIGKPPLYSQKEQEKRPRSRKKLTPCDIS